MGGAAKVVRDHATAFRAFADVREIVFNRTDGVDFEGNEVISLDVDGGGGLGDRLANFLRRVVRYGKFKENWQPDVSIAHLEGAHYVDLISRRSEKVVLVLHGSINHNRDFTGLMGAIRRRILIPQTLRRADAVVAVSRDIAAEMVGMGINGVRVINNYFDLELIAAKSADDLAPEYQHLFDGPPVIITAGRLAHQKNQAPLLEAFARMRGKVSSRLVILGDGPLRDDLIAEAARLCLRVSSPWTVIDYEADVHFLGVQANPFAFIARSALFVLPSAWEGFPLALCEAMACGKPVVSADCPTGPREILAPSSPVPATPITFAEEASYGSLMPIPGRETSSIGLWADTLSKLLSDADRRQRMGEAARKRVMDYTADAIIPQWRALFEELLETSANSRS